MRDLETESLWSHILGQAMRGPLEGEQLSILPSEITTWADWHSRYPETTVLNLSRTAEIFDTEDTQLGARGELGYGIRVHGEAKAYSRSFLRENPLFHDEVGGEPIVLVSDSDAVRTVAFFRKDVDRELRFHATEDATVAREEETGRLWNLRTGSSPDSDPVSLERALGYITYLSAWERFFPESEIVRQRP